MFHSRENPLAHLANNSEHSVSWYKYPWLHYQEADDSCLVADKCGLSSSADDAFIRTGFSNGKYEKHQSSLSHRDAMDQVAGKNRDVDEMLRGMSNKRLKIGRC